MAFDEPSALHPGFVIRIIYLSIQALPLALVLEPRLSSTCQEDGFLTGPLIQDPCVVFKNVQLRYILDVHVFSF